MNRPVSWVGFAIMVFAVVVGFVPTLPSILMLFATTLLGGYYIKKNHEEDYDNFLTLFGYGVVGANAIAVGMIMLTPLDYIDKASASFLNLMVIFIIITLLKIKKDGGKT